MTKYQILLAVKQSGIMKPLSQEFMLPTQWESWMEIYAYMLDHPEMSQDDVAYDFHISQHKVSCAYTFMNQKIDDEIVFSSLIRVWRCLKKAVPLHSKTSDSGNERSK